MKIDPYKSKQSYLTWKEKTTNGIPGLTPENSRVIKRFLQDMEQGVNIGKGTRKGGRSYIRLITLRLKLVFLAEHFEQRFGTDMLAVTDEQLHAFFTGMRSGEIRKKDGGEYRSTADYVKVFRAFWHWYQKVERKKGRHVPDICVDLDDSREKPPWVYLREEDVRRLMHHATFKYKVLLLFLYDSGIRSPTELVNLRVADLSDKCTKLSIRDETSKTFGRTINLLLCPKLLRDYIKEQNLKETDQLFPICPGSTNRHLRRLAKRVLGDGKTLGGAPYLALTMYDLRHSSACYWLPRYKSESALKYRFGWKRSEMIHYYTEFLGMKDTITEADICVDDEKNMYERKAEVAEREKRQLQDEVSALQSQMDQILGVVKRLVDKTGDTATPADNLSHPLQET